MISICLCDDDIQITTLLERHIHEYSLTYGIQLSLDIYNDSVLLLKALHHKKNYDIYFLDIIMPGNNGMDIAHNIREFDETASIIFLTSSPEFAVESYEVMADNYLLKPIDSQKLERALAKSIEKLPTDKEEMLIIKEKNLVKKIPYSAISYFESKRNIIHVHLRNGEELTTYGTLSNLEDSLAKYSEFIRVQRSYIINMNHIQAFSTLEVVVAPNCHIPLSSKYCPTVKKAYIEFSKTTLSR